MSQRLLLGSNKQYRQLTILYSRYLSELVTFNYPGVIIYISLTWRWASEESKKYFGTTVPFMVYFHQGRKVFFESPWHRGPAEKVMKQLEQQREKWISQNRKETTKRSQRLKQWLRENPLNPNRSLKEYINILSSLLDIFHWAHIPFQISTHLDRPLEEKIQQVFYQQICIYYF